MRIGLSRRLQDWHVDTPGHRPTLEPYRGVPHERLRNRDGGDPLNLIRVMPAKGQEHSMSTSIFLAKLIGPVCLVIGLALLLNRAAFRTLAGQFLDSPPLMFLSGVITLPVGLAIVLSHNVWAGDWRILITIIGWLGIIGGVARILVPQRAAAVGRTMLANPSTLCISAGVYLVFGALLSFYGYRH